MDNIEIFDANYITGDLRKRLYNIDDSVRYLLILTVYP